MSVRSTAFQRLTPADSVAVQVSPDGGSLYVVVGTPTVGNVQVYAIAP